MNDGGPPRSTVTRDEARRLFREALRLYDVACMAFTRSGGDPGTAPLLQKATYAAVGVVARLHGSNPAGYVEAVHEAQRINATARFLAADISVPLLSLAEVSALEASPASSGDSGGRARGERYREVFAWTPDLFAAVATLLRREFPETPLLWDMPRWRVPAQAFLATRALVFLVGYAGLRLAPPTRMPWSAFPGNAWLDGWVRWDAAWYRSVVERGYDALRTGAPPNVIFFPLYPIVSHLLSLPLAGSSNASATYYAVALVVSAASFLLGLVGLHRLTDKVAGPRAATRAVWLASLFPFSYVFSTAYPESLFLALSVWTFVLAVEEKWLAAAALASLAGVTQQPGLALIVALALLHRRRRVEAPGVRRPRLVWITAVAASAPAMLMVYFATRYHDPFVFVRAYFDGWGGSVGLAHWVRLARFLGGDPPLGEAIPFLWIIVLVPLTGLAGLAVHRKYGAAYGILCAVSFVVGLLVTASGYGRLAAVTFPIFMWAGARLRDRAAFAITCAMCAPSLAALACSFSHWGSTGGP